MRISNQFANYVYFVYSCILYICNYINLFQRWSCTGSDAGPGRDDVALRGQVHRGLGGGHQARLWSVSLPQREQVQGPVRQWSEGGERWVMSTGNGPWLCLCQEGYGQFWWTEGPSRGDKYIGFFMSDQRHGEGSYYFANGDVFTGGWRAGQQHGPGYQTFPNGNILDGSWHNGQRHGVFIFVFPNGARYQTVFQRGERRGAWHQIEPVPHNPEYFRNWKLLSLHNDSSSQWI